MGGGDDGVGGGGVNGRVDWWNNLVMCEGGCREGVGCGVWGVERDMGRVWGCREGV